MHLAYRLLNVFGLEGDAFSGNPLCVFEHAEGLDAGQMQSWARQFNLSETTFVTAVRSDEPGADVRIFTASYEMPFAGHPTLGTAHVVASLLSDAVLDAPPDDLVLTMPAGRIPVRRTDRGWQLDVRSGRSRAVSASDGELAAALGIAPDRVVAARWVDVGVEQLLVELVDAEAVRSCQPVVGLMRQHMSADGRAPHVYPWAWTGDTSIEARLFAAAGSALEEDPATGSACSNLGAWLAERGRRDLDVTVSQGAQVNRPSRLDLSIDGAGLVRVGGRVTEVGRGSVTPPESVARS